MIEAAAMWATSVYSWLTPAVLFLLLNLVIATIALTAKSTRLHHPSSATGHTTLLSRSSSVVLDRLKSFTFSSHHHIHTEPVPVPEPEPVSAPVPEPHHIDRSQSDTKPTAGEMLEKLPKKMKKSATVKSAFKHFDFGSNKDEEREEEIATPKRPATTRVRGWEQREEVGEVDARADDFINRFRHQLRLQRLDSIIRYKEMIKRGAD